MRELKLKYFIDLVSNLGPKAQQDAKAMQQAQAVMAAAITGTNSKWQDYSKLTLLAGKNTATMQEVLTGATNKFAALDRAITQAGRNTSLERQASYLQRLANMADLARGKAQQARDALARVGAGAGKIAQVGAGVAAGGAVASAMADKPIDYDTRLRGVTATAFAGRDLAGLRAGREEINRLVVGAVRQAPGASRDATLAAFERLVGTGSFTYDESSALLPSVMRTSVASRADALDLVQTAEKLKVNLQLPPQQIELALAKIMRAGQAGGFEIKDSAKWIPELLPYMKGYTGMDAVEQLVTMLQQARSTAGTNDTAANNLRNFLQKMQADSTRKEFQKRHGIDLDKEMAAGIAAGQSPVDTYLGVFDRLIAKADPDGQARKAMLSADQSASAEERTRRYEAIKDRFSGSAVATIINDLQEFGGYEGLRRTTKYRDDVLKAVRAENGGAIQTGFAFMAEGAGAKATAVANEKDIAATNVLEASAPALNSMLDAVTAAAREYPVMTTAVVGATGALGVFATALGASGIVGLLTGKAGAGAGGAVGAVAGAGAAAASGGGGMLAAAAPWLAKASLATGAAWGAYKTYELGDALWQWHGVNNREGVALTPEARARLAGLSDRATARAMGVAPLGIQDVLTLTAPGVPQAPLGLGQSTELKIGEGVLSVDVRVTDERATASLNVVKPLPSLVRIDAGNTNPAGYR